MKMKKKGLKQVLLVLPLTDKIISSSSAAECLTPDRLTREREKRGESPEMITHTE